MHPPAGNMHGLQPLSSRTICASGTADDHTIDVEAYDIEFNHKFTIYLFIDSDHSHKLPN